MDYGTRVTVKDNWALVYMGNCTRKKMKIPNVVKSIFTGGRREQLSMANILQFVTGADEEQVLGFRIPPTFQFPEVIHSFLPTANTCIDSLQVPRPKQGIDASFPEDAELIALYDYATSNLYCGLQ